MRRSVKLLGLTCVGASLAALAGCDAQMYRPNPQPDPTVVALIRGDAGVAAKEAQGADGKPAAEAPAEEAAAGGAGWGTLKGQFVLEGDAPALAALSTGGKDGAVCGNQVPNQTLVVDSGNKGIANIVLYARKVSRVFKPDGGEDKPVERVFDQKNCIFLSHVLAMRVQDPLHIRNSDPIGHNTNLAPPGNPGINPLLPSNGDASYQFKKQLPFPSPVVCNIHPWMKAYIIARDNSYYAVTGPDGSFEIANLPAGEEIEFQVWHEMAESGLVAMPEWSRGRFKDKLGENETKDLGQINTPVAAFQ